MTNLIPYRYRNSLTRSNNDDNWFGSDFFRPFFTGDMWAQNAFRVDVRDEGENYLLEAELPGMKRENVHVDVEDGVLTISADRNGESKEEKNGYIMNERRSGTFSRSFTLENIKEDDIRAEYADGVLKLTMPKAVEPKKQSRRIDIQ